ncbi:hypothetical protein AUK40_02620 [Candidatus Wirthbacteria bacterium CG2_30_54_11]|uniref:Uncharacterized protein n=1 Tax=Candidatus Wirthbacteria bacterium CG2_30_54_11 TaxID=1817892 RepID=A0A1J5IZN7_9BACT|nr:MAG: hypothetical protein AUK40_02620 [Candidatus Wirthbacteria bacterium CG2_30_54_11]
MLHYLVIVGATAQLLGILSYIRNTIKGKTRPNRVTWLLWALAPMIGTVAALSDGVRWAILPVFMAGFGPLLVLIASFFNKQSYWQLKPFDYLCGLFSLLAMVLWAITRQPEVAIVFAILSDAFAAIPTLMKSWTHPETESIGPFIGGVLSQSTAFFAIQTWTLTSVAFPSYLVILNLWFIAIMTRYRFTHKKKEQHGR